MITSFKRHYHFGFVFCLVVALLMPLASHGKLPSETYVGSISWSPDGEKLVVGYKKHVAAIVKNKTGEIILELDPAKGGPIDKRFSIKAESNMKRYNWSPVAWSSDGKYVAVAHYLNVFVFDSLSGRLINSRSSKRAKDFDPERRWAPILPTKKSATNSDGWRELKSYVTGLAWSGDSTKLAISDANGVHVVDIENGVEVYTYKPLQHRSFVVSWTKDGSKLATISFNFSEKTKSLHIWNANTGKTLRELKGIKHLDWSPDNKHLAYDTYKGIVIYDPVKGRITNKIKTDDEFPIFYWSPNGKYLAVSDETEIVKIVNAKSGRQIDSFKQSQGKAFRDIYPSVFAWSPDGSTLAIGKEDFELGFWQPIF